MPLPVLIQTPKKELEMARAERKITIFGDYRNEDKATFFEKNSVIISQFSLLQQLRKGLRRFQIQMQLEKPETHEVLTEAANVETF